MRQVAFRLLTTVLLVGICAAAPAAETTPSSANRFDGDVWIGLGALSGSVTYEIGGRIEQDGDVSYTHFPLSRLEWPLNVAMVSLGGNARYGNLEGRAAFAFNATSDAGKIEDSDWEVEDDPGLLTTYSESDTELTARQVDAGLRYWFRLAQINSNAAVKVSAGAGFLYQYFYWIASDLDQWYPSDPSFDHDYHDGRVGTYEAQLYMPYLELAARINAGGFDLTGRIGYAPYAMVHDDDDHELRSIRATTDADGWGLLGELAARYTFLSRRAVAPFVQISVSSVMFDVEGTEEDEVYGGMYEGMTWEIEHTVESSQLSGTLAAGITF